MRKIISALLAFAIITTAATGCSDSASSTALSNPVKVTADGDVDMDVALAYETDFDALKAELEAKTPDGTDTVSDNTNPATQKVFDYLRENYGTNMLAGQQMFALQSHEDTLYYAVTGDLPAIKGFDMIYATTDEIGETNQQVDMAIDWWKESGGLVAFAWHWNVPKDIDNPDGGKAFYADEISNFSYINAVTPGTAEYKQVIHDIDLVAIQLQKLEAAGVPVIWRPLHEASGSWFWWGKINGDTVKAECYQKLWYMIYDRLENYHKLTNLIWLWNGQNKFMSVSPNTYDIGGTDIYPTSLDHSSQVGGYNSLADITDSSKMLTLSECGYIPDITECQNDKAMWLYYMPWYGDFVYATSGTGSPILNLDSIPKINEERLTEDFLKTMFASENVITWSELPEWEGTTHKLPIRLATIFPELKDNY